MPFGAPPPMRKKSEKFFSCSRKYAMLVPPQPSTHNRSPEHDNHEFFRSFEITVAIRPPDGVSIAVAGE